MMGCGECVTQRRPEANANLCGYADVLSQEFRRKVGAALPGQGVEGKSKSFELIRVPKRAEDRAFEFLRQVHLSADAVAEPQPNRIVPNITGFDNMQEHITHRQFCPLPHGRGSD